MIKGKLTANLNPPYVEFFLNDSHCSRHECTSEDLRRLLIALNAIGPDESWCPPREMLFCITGEFPRRSLEELGLI